MNLKKLIAGVIAAFVMFTGVNAQAGDNGSSKKIVVTITDSSTMKSGFGLAVANAMQDAGVQSTVFITAEAVKFALKKGNNEKFAGATPREWISNLIKKGGKVMVCEGFVKLGVIKKEDMIEGIGVSSPAYLAGALFAPNSKAMTF